MAKQTYKQYIVSLGKAYDRQFRLTKVKGYILDMIVQFCFTTCAPKNVSNKLLLILEITPVVFCVQGARHSS